MSSNPYNNAFNSIYSQESGKDNESAALTPGINNNDDQDRLHVQNEDTFLSRIFGLNSIYNQLQDNYQYYDPEYDSTFQQQQQQQQQRRALLSEDVIGNNRGSDSVGGSAIGAGLAPSNQEDLDESLLPSAIPMDNLQNMQNIVTNSNSLLDSESDSDLSSSSDSYVRPRPNRAKLDKKQQQQQPQNKGVEMHLNQSQTAPPKAPLTQLAPNPQPSTGPIIVDSQHTLPLHNMTKSYRKPPQQQYVNTNYKPTRTRANRLVIPPKERALYLWANITNMDEFLNDVYYYYRGKGLLNIVLSRIVDLIILVFIIGFTIFLKWGIDYSLFYEQYRNGIHYVLADLITEDFASRVPFLVKFLVFGFTLYIILRSIQLYFDFTYKLKEVQNFYRYLLNVGDDELSTISWKTIVERLMLLKDYNSLTSSSNPTENHYINDLSSKVRLDAHDIANRIMRRDNYMIALINKDVLDLSVLFMDQKQSLTKTLEWNLKLCIDNFVFNQQGQINGSILKDYNRNQLARELTSRFKLAAMINVVLCPFIVVYFVLLYFFKYFNEYKSNPSSIVGVRQYTPYAEWKLREFNELPHFFQNRLQLSMTPANTYIDQFPKGFLVINGMKLINFLSGSVLAVLVVLGIFLDNESQSFWSFEITEGKTTLFYISVLGTIWAITSSSSSTAAATATEQNQQHFSTTRTIHDPEANIRYVSKFTHYLPRSWKKRLHTVQVKNEFCQLYSLKIVIIIYEILSLILTPYILWFKVSQNSGTIIDFFREYSIHVDGLGYVCYFAMFNFEEKDKNMMASGKQRRKKRNKRNSRNQQNSDTPSPGQDSDPSDEEGDDDDDGEIYSLQRDHKMVKSYYHFMQNYNDEDTAAAANGTRPIRRNAKPLTSSITSQFNSNATQMGYNAEENDGDNDDELTDSIFKLNYNKIDGDLGNDLSRNKSKRKGGVLGMLNQFYKQDIGRNV
ncbi:ATG9 [Candida margitis]|uniref:ATG9 n=1 Tax=Candida margitis TaxID=1775924 RepID=UPI0022268A77|nr:ATG9 [Candida margitis]KAI5950627.1 ATG9 [Candida margitis]